MLKDGGNTTRLTSITTGFMRRGDSPETGAIAVVIPQSSENSERSVCGLKDFLIDERRYFSVEEREHGVDCAKVAVLDIENSPVHVHGETLETYHVLSGRGSMVLGREVIDVSAGTYILIPPHVPHGMKSSGPEPVRVLMTFTPGMAPVSRQEFRDEKILSPDIDANIAGLRGGAAIPPCAPEG